MNFFKYKLKETKRYTYYYHQHCLNEGLEFSNSKIYEFKAKELRELGFLFRLIRNTQYDIEYGQLCYYYRDNFIYGISAINGDKFMENIIDIEMLIDIENHLGLGEPSVETYKNKQRLFNKYFGKYLIFI